METEKESIKVLRECIEVQLKKSRDYQNPNSSVKQADYYPRGIASIFDIINAKTLRIKSVMEAMEADPNYKQNFESLEDSAKDLANYCSFFAAYLRNGIDGQRFDRDCFNKPALGPVGASGGIGSVGVLTGFCEQAPSMADQVFATDREWTEYLRTVNTVPLNRDQINLEEELPALNQ